MARTWTIRRRSATAKTRNASTNWYGDGSRLLPHAIALDQDPAMVQLVPRDIPCEGANAGRLVVRDPAPDQRLLVHRLEQGDGGRAHQLVLENDVGERPRVETARRHVDILVEARERRRVPAPDAERAIREHALRVREMPHDFLHAPLSRRVSMERLRLVERPEQPGGLSDLTPQGGHGVIPRHEVDVLLVVLEELVLCRAWDRERRGHGFSWDWGRPGPRPRF